jgi:hypothetical protein
MQAITTVCLDIAKLVFQLHNVDAVGQMVIRRQPQQRSCELRNGRLHISTF